jgi:hypothetical protein
VGTSSQLPPKKSVDIVTAASLVSLEGQIMWGSGMGARDRAGRE